MNQRELLKQQIKATLETAKSELESALEDLSVAINSDDDLYGMRRRIRCANSLVLSSANKLSRSDGMSELWSLTEEKKENS